MKVALCLSSRTTENVENLGPLFDWAWGGERAHEFRFFCDTSFGIAQSRSLLIDKAKSWGAEWLIFVDMDIMPLRPFPEVMSFLNQDRSRGYGLVCSPYHSYNNVLLIQGPNGPFKSVDEVNGHGLTEISTGPAGFMAIHRDAMDKLAVLKMGDAVNHAKFPMYCEHSGDVGEDASLCYNVTKNTGLKCGADARLVVFHFKRQPRPSYFKPKAAE